MDRDCLENRSRHDNRRPRIGKALQCAILGGSALLSCVILLTGCQGNSPSARSVVEISFATADSGDGLAFLQKLIREFEQEYPHVQVKLVHIPSGGYSVKMLTRFAAGSPPDAFMVYNQVEMLYYARKGILMPLDKLMAEDKEFSKEALFESTLALCTIDGKLYGLPKEGNPFILFYNRDLFNKARLRYPDETWTWDDYYRAAKRLTKESEGDGRTDVYGTNSLINPDLLFTMTRQQGGNIFRNGKPLLETPEAVRSLEFMSRLCREGLAPRARDLRDVGQQELFATGKLAMMPHFPYIIRWANSAIKGFEYDIAPLPVFSPDRRVVESICSGYAVSSRTEHPKEAWLLVKFLGGERGQRIVAREKYGVPVVKSIAYSDEFGPPPPGVRAAVESMKYGEPYPVFIGVREANEVIKRELSNSRLMTCMRQAGSGRAKLRLSQTPAPAQTELRPPKLSRRRNASS